MPRRFLSVLFGLLICATLVHAVEFRVLGWSTDDNSLRFDQGRSTTDVQVETDRLSSVYVAPGAESVTLYRPIKTADGKPGQQIACELVVPPGLKQGIVLLIPAVPVSSWIKPSQAIAPDAAHMRVPPTYHYHWLDDSIEARPPGTIEFRNLQALPVAVRIGDREIEVPPHGKAQIPLVPGARRIGFRAATLIDGKWRVFASSPLPTRGPDRILVIFREVEGSQRTGPADTGIRIVRLYEAAPAPAPASTPVSDN
ncbi:MAG TPA: hypothetical protein VIO38_03495 [Rariglobus sp.]